jgi:hypothetical protein
MGVLALFQDLDFIALQLQLLGLHFLLVYYFYGHALVGFVRDSEADLAELALAQLRLLLKGVLFKHVPVPSHLLEDLATLLALGLVFEEQFARFLPGDDDFENVVSYSFFNHGVPYFNLCANERVHKLLLPDLFTFLGTLVKTDIFSINLGQKRLHLAILLFQEYFCLKSLHDAA